MRLSTVILTCVMLLSGVVAAEDKRIFKCTGSDGTLYSDNPCVAPQPASMRALQAIEIKPSEPIADTSSVASTGGDANWGRLSAAPLSSTRIFIGMTDTQVLNLVRYGKPARISRTRDGPTWHEWWTYIYADTGLPREVLHFANGRLVEQEQPQPPTSTASLGLSMREQ